MTEQEKREKTIYAQYRDEINQMYDDIVNNGCPIPTDNFKVCYYVRDAGYRKADEVRKETIKEFIDFVKNVIYNYKPKVTETDSGIKTYHYLTDYQLLDIIKEKYSAEVKE